ncbi:DUF3598 family protein [Sphaerospermopsis kisseleviana CS-549]|uniref:DUF3598 family protein n=1 Tax=Sphaerospermopsis kisseleviana CS-549 TaxID=3021783 RepID=A0ABT4ZVS8_9CYAN|nr:DUF3598 family protein [Sphaerospermopsis kisseleviana]MDB9443536.1 DUF3598 family protein [Sphaerospermopsis kisseleviana CS-549]BAZ80685.1 hypothetical protein NIES73_19480 [Sphaerospermopsis kisseleviana NIES-73]
MTSNWENFIKNIGEWRGSFTQISPQGEILKSTPSILNLEAIDNNQAVLFRLRRFDSNNYDSSPIQDYQQEYRSLAKENIFFNTGAFAKGTLQLAPFTEFGAEYGFIDENRRSRLVQLFDKQGKFSNLTLIREFRTGTEAKERPPLTVEQLIGKWEGQAHTVYSDLSPSETNTSYLEIKELDNGYLEHKLSFAGQNISSKAKIAGNKLIFEKEGNIREILLLPDGISSNVPVQLELRKPFFVEAGWLVTDNERQRLIRTYNAKGEWISSTHVIEIKNI